PWLVAQSFVLPIVTVSATSGSCALALHDALPISRAFSPSSPGKAASRARYACTRSTCTRSARRSTAVFRRSPRASRRGASSPVRSEEHTSELQSRENLVCRLLLEKNKKERLVPCH